MISTALLFWRSDVRSRMTAECLIFVSGVDRIWGISRQQGPRARHSLPLPGNAGEGAIEDRGQRARSGLRSGLTRIAAGRGLVATWTAGEAMASCSVSAVLPQ